MFEKVSTALDFLAREKEVIKFWNENNIFEKSIDQREGSDVYTFFDGPPTANGKPHIGHIETRAIKDLIHPWFAGRAGSGEVAGPGWQRADRGLWHRTLHSGMQEICLEIQGRMGEDVRARGLLGRHEKSLYHL